MERIFPYGFDSSLFAINLSVAAMTVLTAAVVAAVVLAAVRRLDMRRPSGLQNFIEWVMEFVRNQASQLMDRESAGKFLALGLTLFVYLFVANWLGLIGNFVVVYSHGIPSLGIAPGRHVSYFLSPTADMFDALGLSFMTLLYAHYIGLRRPGLYFRHLASPRWPMIPLNLIDEVAAFFTLGMRLYGNIWAGEMLIEFIMKIPPLFGVPVSAVPLFIWIGWSAFVSTLQAFVFTLLTFAYISRKLFQEAH